MKRSLNLLLLFAILAIPAFAERISRTEAQRIAQNFFAKKLQRNVKTTLMALPKRLLPSASTTPSYAPFYIYNVENNGGFVIVSGDDAIGNIIGYSDNGTFDLEGAPDNVVTMMQMFARTMKPTAYRLYRLRKRRRTSGTTRRSEGETTTKKHSMGARCTIL